MLSIRMIKAVISEYGAGWAVNRSLYSLKLKTMGIAPPIDKLFEKKTPYPRRLDLFEIDIQAIQKYIQGLNEEDKRKLVEAADKACEGIITGFSSIELNYGNPIDWQLSPLTGKQCDEKKKWYKIPDFDKERGDIKVIWEASRFSYFITLARAYLLTEDEKYYKAFTSQLKEWLKKNSYSYGANFKCSQECSLRMVNTLLAYTVFHDKGMTTDEDVSNVKDLVDRCYRKVLSNFFYAYKCIKNNHTISELMGMIVGAWCCGADRQLSKAYKLLDEVIDEQFTDDGGYRQFSFNYQRLALQDLECVLSIARKTDKDINSHSKDKIKNAAYLMYQCQDESWDVPNYGNNDGALVFPVTSCGYRDFRPVINTAYTLITGEQLYDADKHQEELLWFAGGKNIHDFATLKADKVSSQFVNAGLFTIRGQDSWAMVVLNDYTSRPAHMDQLHLDLWVGGVNVLCDGGTYSYASEEGRKLVKNESHNTAVVDSVSQMNSKGSFLIYDWCRSKLKTCGDSCFEGMMISANGYKHIREIKQVGASYEISDLVDKNYKILFHTPCEIILVDEKARLLNGGKVLCEISSTGQIALDTGQRSLYYLRKDSTNCLSITGQAGVKNKTTIAIVKESKK
ncbi:heparinase II/III family protein [Roseburia hominis]